MMEIVISMGIFGVMLSMLGMGLLIAYYGSSKTRNVGFLFLVFGIVIAYYLVEMDTSNVALWNGVLAFLGGMVGGIVGIIVFLVAIIKS